MTSNRVGLLPNGLSLLMIDGHLNWRILRTAGTPLQAGRTAFVNRTCANSEDVRQAFFPQPT